MKILKPILIILMMFCCLAPNLYSQAFDNQIDEPAEIRKPRPAWRERVFFGGIFALQFGTVTAIEVSPLVGYKLTNHLSVAGGIKYEYLSDKRFSPPYSTHIYGLRTFVRLYLIRNMGDFLGGGLAMGFYLQAEYEGLSLERQYFDYPNYPDDGRFWLHSPLIGGGISVPTGPYGSFNFSVLYNLNETYNSIYSNPVIRIGFNF